MIRRLTIPWPGGGVDRASSGRPIRLLAVSDEPTAALASEENRRELQPLDAVLGCGDLDAGYLAFVADAFRVPLLYVRGNHDRGGGWEAHGQRLPEPIAPGRIESIAGVGIAGFGWPSSGTARYARDENSAWMQVLPFAFRRLTGRSTPQVVLSHVAPLGAGDTPDDPFHVGFAAYRWLALRLRPRLWLHGHTTPASVPALRSRLGSTEVVNVTGAVFIELVPQPVATGRRAEEEHAIARAR